MLLNNLTCILNRYLLFCSSTVYKWRNFSSCYWAKSTLFYIQKKVICNESTLLLGVKLIGIEADLNISFGDRYEWGYNFKDYGICVIYAIRENQKFIKDL